MRFHIVTLKTLKDLLSIKRIMIFLIISLTGLSLILTIIEEEMGPQLGRMTLAMQTQIMIGVFTIFSYIWMAGIPLVFLCIITCADFICGENEKGTLLLLVSRPIRRYEIVIGKFLAFFLNTLLLESIVLLASPLIISHIFRIDPSTLDFLMEMVPQVFLYSVFIVLIFGSMSTALSVLLDSKVKIIVELVVLVILVYFGFMIIRQFTISYGIYEDYKLYAFDVNYHLGNMYFLFLEQSKNYRIMPDFQAQIGQFTGTYETTGTYGPKSRETLFDRDLMAMPPTLKLNDYVNPLASMFMWLFISAVLFSIALIKFERKEIY